MGALVHGLAGRALILKTRRDSKEAFLSPSDRSCTHSQTHFPLTCFHPETPYFLPSLERLCRNPFFCLCERPSGAWQSRFSMTYEIASVVSLPRNDVVTHSPRGEGVSGWKVTCLKYLKHSPFATIEFLLRHNQAAHKPRAAHHFWLIYPLSERMRILGLRMRMSGNTRQVMIYPLGTCEKEFSPSVKANLPSDRQYYKDGA